jgi:D-lactate dehydrogenase
MSRDTSETRSGTPVKISVFSTKPYDRHFLEEANEAGAFGHELQFFEPRLDETTVPLAHGSPAVSAFVNDDLGEPVLDELASRGTRLIVLRSAGFNNVDLEVARDLGIRVMRVPDYSPYAVAEFTVGLILSLDRHLARAYARVRDGNFSLDGLLGFDLHAKTAGIIGTGKIGGIVARNLRFGFGCRVLAYDPFPSAELAEDVVTYVGLDELLAESDIVSLHCLLTAGTHHLIDREAIAKMKRGVMLINTSRGGLIDTGVVIAGLKSGRIGHLGLDVYEEEARFFYEDYSSRLIQDDTLSRLLTFPNVIVTSHQGFFTAEAMQQIAHTTLGNATCFEQSCESPNEVRAQPRVQGERPAA